MASQDVVPTFSRKPYHGSCHCGTIKYIAYLTLPEPTSSTPSLETLAKTSGLQIYKCNCTVCHKMGIFHLRLASAPDDFLLLAPAQGPDGEGSGVRKYQCNAKKSSWYFCENCGVRCFTVFAKESESVEIELPSTLLQRSGVGEGDAAGMEKVKVWRIGKDFKEGKGGNGYFSINAATLDEGQEGLDLREWHEKGWIAYVDSLEKKHSFQIGKPHRGGMY